MPTTMHYLLPLVVAALICWRVYYRVRRLVGRQPVRRTRLALTLFFFPLAVLLLAFSGLSDPERIAGLALGLVGGVLLAWLGLRMTRFESTPEGHFFTPNAKIGIALSVLFIGRLIYRFGFVFASTGRVDPTTMQSFGSSALTLGIFGLLAGYYTAYALGVLAWVRRTRSAGAPPDATADIGNV
jgi:hypothetical protein